jgi:chemotaxis protein histidine kinase CheA
MNQSFLEEFRTESLEHLDKLDAGLLALERDPSKQELVRGLYLSAHTIKGGASMLGLNAIKTFTHGFEDVLARLRDGEHLTPGTASLLLESVDRLRALVDDPNAEADETTLALSARLRDRAAGVEPQATAINEAAPLEPVSTAPSQPTVLLIEPSITTRTAQAMPLRQAGFTVIELEDFENALEIMKDAQAVIAAVEFDPQPALEFLASQPDMPVILTYLDDPPAIPVSASTHLVRKASWRDTTLLETLQQLTPARSTGGPA